MLPKTKQQLGKPFVVRLEHSQKEEVQAVATANDLTVSDIIRMAVRHHLPVIKSGQAKLRQPAGTAEI